MKSKKGLMKNGRVNLEEPHFVDRSTAKTTGTISMNDSSFFSALVADMLLVPCDFF